MVTGPMTVLRRRRLPRGHLRHLPALHVRIIEELVGAIREIRVSGGAARSTTFNQIQADVYGKPVLRSVSEQSSGLGALILAAWAVGKYSSIGQAVDALLEFDPGVWLQSREEYHAVHERVGELHDAGPEQGRRVHEGRRAHEIPALRITGSCYRRKNLKAFATCKE